jgi:hypothetical protein
MTEWPHYFQPGNTEGKGRPPGKPNRRSLELQQRLKDRGDTDPAEYCSSIVSSDKEPTELKLAAANYLLPYLYPKRGALPPPRFVELEIDVNEFTHVSDAENFLAKIALLVARGHLDIQSGQELSGLVKAWIDTQYAKDELQFKINPPETRDTTIRIEGGLPALPGTNITMPTLEHGPVTNGHALAPPSPVVADDAGMNSTNGRGAPPGSPETQDQGS